MSIISQLLHGKITWQTAARQIEAWGAKTVGDSPALIGATSVVISDLKQAASNAIMLADSMAGPLLAAGADAVNAAFTVAATKYLGPFGAVVSPAAHDAIDKIRDGLKAEIDAAAMAMKASLAPAPGATAAPPLAQASSGAGAGS